MTQEGKVISVDGNTAKVLVMRRSACEGCNQKALCHGGSCSEEKTLETVVKNPIGAKIGDRVLVSSSSGLILGVCFCVFVLPIIAAILAYLFASNYFSGYEYAVSGITFAVTCAFFAVFFNNKFKKDPQTEIIKILGEDN